MKKILFILLLLPALASSQTVVVTGQLQTYGLSGAGVKGDVVIKQVLRSGYLLPIVEYSPPVSNTGVFRFSLPATVGTDTTKAKIYINTPQWRGANGEGVWVSIPSGATVALSSLTPATYIPSTYPVVVPLITLSDSTTGLSVVTDTIRLGAGLKLIPATNGGGNPTIIGTATGGGGSDSVHVADSLARVAIDSTIAHRAQIDTKQNTLSAAQVARLDSSLASGYAISITSQGTIQIIAVDTTGWFAAFGGVMVESDPVAIDSVGNVRSTLDGHATDIASATATANAALPLANFDDSLSVALTNGARSISSTGRMFVTDDSVSLTVAPNETINAALGNTFRGTLPQNDTLSIANMQDGQVLQFVLTNANNFTLTWSGVAWPGGTQPTATAVANKRTIYSFVKAGGVIYGVSVLNF